MPAGRPTDYTPELADLICEQVALGQTMRTIAAKEEFPAMSTMFKWLRIHSEFAEQYARAKEEACDYLFEETLDIADDGTNDWVESHDPKNPGYQFNGEHMQRSRLRVDTRKWALSKLKPKKYGDKTQQEVTGANGGPIRTDNKYTVEFLNPSDG